MRTNNNFSSQVKINHCILNESKFWSKKIPKIRKIIKLLFKYPSYFINKKFLQYDIVFLLSDDKRIKKLYKKYKKISKSTDVLTFTNSYKLINQKNVKIINVIMSAETIKKDSIKLKKNFYEHFAHLVIHSMLHSNGYDHYNLKKRKIMEGLEISILNRFINRSSFL